MAQTVINQVSEKEISDIFSGNYKSILTPEEGEKGKEPEKKPDETEVKEPEKFKKVIDTNFKWNELKGSDDEEKQEDTSEIKGEEVKEGEEKTPEKKAGRKPVEVVSLVNQMVEEGEMVGFDDGEVKTIEEAKELVKLNLRQAKEATLEDVWKDKLGSYSPQVQAILQYAESGGTDIYPLLSAIAEAERTSDFSVENQEGQEQIVREYLKISGWEDDDIKDEIDTAKDLDKLKTKAEKFLPKLNQMKEERVQMIMQDQEQRKVKADEARKNYLGRLKTTLDKDKVGDIKLARQDKALIWNALTDVTHTSLSGNPTNAFFKKLEDLQIGQNADYDHYMEIVHLAMDPEGFKKKVREQVATEEAASTARKLKIAEKKIPTVSEGFAEEQTTKSGKIQRQSFKNPWG